MIEIKIYNMAHKDHCELIIDRNNTREITGLITNYEANIIIKVINNKNLALLNLQHKFKVKRTIKID
jgi:hypothetical protein